MQILSSPFPLGSGVVLVRNRGKGLIGVLNVG